MLDSFVLEKENMFSRYSKQRMSFAYIEHADAEKLLQDMYWYSKFVELNKSHKQRI